ncbi:MAG: transposase family protein [Nostoc sp. NOS(2021)]|nr:transposase family protein [Nostoc sp. NOS(2021)]
MNKLGCDRYVNLYCFELHGLSAVVLQDTASLKQTRGYPNKLALEEQALVCLQYWREYRTYFHIASDWQIS